MQLLLLPAASCVLLLHHALLHVRCCVTCAAAACCRRLARWKKKHSADQEALTAHDVSSLHGSQAYAHAVAGSGAADKGMGARGRVQAGGEQDDSRLQVPMNVSSSYRWLEDAITEWQVCSTEQEEARVASGKWGEDRGTGGA